MSALYDITGTEAKARSATQVPLPAGFNLLVALPEVAEKTQGGIIRPDELREREATAALVGFVMKLGAECYADKKLFPNGPWCKEGDWVLFRPYTGTRLLIHGQEFRIMKDQEVIGVVENPAGIIRSNRA